MLDVQLPRSAVDVNVVPDKRTVMMQCEQEVVHALEQVCVCVCLRERGRGRYVLGSGLTKALWRDAVRAGGGARPRAGVCCVLCVCVVYV